MAKLFGAGKVIALGRNERVLRSLPALGPDATISLNQPDKDIIEAIAQEAKETGINVIVDYLWGHPTEIVIAAVTRKGLTHVSPRVRLIEIGQMAGSNIALPASVLRSSGLEISGSGAGTIPLEKIMEAVPRFVEYAANGKLHIATASRPLAKVGTAWQQTNEANRRLVFIP
jgi:NADPH:quinone reductase-like Zn-dependent oxidoreductase